MHISKEPKMYCEKIKIIKKKRCIIGESPIWNEREKSLYFANGFGNEICKYDIKKDEMTSIPLSVDCAAIVFDKDNNLIISCKNGIFILKDDGELMDIYDNSKYKIQYANDMKVGPDGKIYVGTQSEKRLGISEKVNGRLYSIDKYGNVKILLDNIRLSNGMEWSMDGKFFYHTDSDTEVIREYVFNNDTGEIFYSGRQVKVCGVDGFTINRNNKIYAACWGKGHIAIIDIANMKIDDYIKIPCNIPASCAFVGENMDILAITTASFDTNIELDRFAGFTILMMNEVQGRLPFLFGQG